MKRLAFLPLLVAFFCIYAVPASLAAETYYIEIGQESSEEEVALQWQAYSEKYSSELKGLEFHPVTVIHQDSKKIGTRIQAGPLRTKMDAYQICGKLYQDKVPCFIVEGAQKTERTLTEESAKQMLSLPWLQGQEEMAVAPQPVPVTVSDAARDDDSGSGFFSWIFGDDDKPVLSEAEITANLDKTGEVEVSEAINVPVTNSLQQPQITAKPTFIGQSRPQPLPAPAIKPLEQRMADREREASEGLSGSIWVVVKSFVSDEVASGFWQDVRQQDAAQTAGLRVKIIRPFLDSGQDRVSLNIGPFAAQADASNFCGQVIRSRNAQLACEFAGVAGQDASESRLITPRFEHGKRYENRRRMHRSRYSGRETALLSDSSRTKIYWVQVAVAENQIDALKSWDELRAQHPDLLEGLRSSVSATLMQGSKYMVRVGPLESGSAATELCTSLTGRGVPCRIYSNM